MVKVKQLPNPVRHQIHATFIKGVKHQLVEVGGPVRRDLRDSLPEEWLTVAEDLDNQVWWKVREDMRKQINKEVPTHL
jgi:hypothetical protein